MAFQTYSLCLSIFLLFHITFKFTKAENLTYLDSRCSDGMMFTPNTKYQTDLNSVFRKLTTKAATATATSATTVENAIYSLFLCRGDLTKTACKNCVATACHDLSQSYCPLNKAAVIWYTGCMVRYSNDSFFGKMDDSPRVVMWNSLNLTQNRTDFKHILDQTMNDLVLQTGNTNAFYATVTKTIFGFWGTTAFSQCTSDLSRSDCTRCLKVAVGELPVSVTGRVLQPSCNVWYEVYKSNNYSEIKYSNDESIRRKVKIAVAVILSGFICIISLYYLWKWRGKKSRSPSKEAEWETIFGGFGSRNGFQDLPLFEFTKLEAATDGFSVNNKLGEGGFGQVYKGILEDGREIAVKRLSRASGQGLQEFINEVTVISKLQHKNLVRLLGCCVEGEEKLLVYELMRNKSLDAFLFDMDQRKRLNWQKRFNIIQGICRGVLYLHRDSRLKIIHRDLKPSNILLDEELNPKISDFGLAKIFDSKQDQDNTIRVAGTCGYMSPEYALQGRFSEKSDVFSFGVLLLEIVSGKSNHNFTDHESLGLLVCAWKLWNDNDMSSFIDPTICNQSVERQIFKCVQVGLLCVQQLPEDRPDFPALNSMLENADNVESLPIANQPGLTRSNEGSNNGIVASGHERCSANLVSVTTLTGR